VPGPSVRQAVPAGATDTPAGPFPEPRHASERTLIEYSVCLSSVVDGAAVLRPLNLGRSTGFQGPLVLKVWPVEISFGGWQDGVDATGQGVLSTECQRCWGESWNRRRKAATETKRDAEGRLRDVDMPDVEGSNDAEPNKRWPFVLIPTCCCC